MLTHDELVRGILEYKEEEIKVTIWNTKRIPIDDLHGLIGWERLFLQTLNTGMPIYLTRDEIVRVEQDGILVKVISEKREEINLNQTKEVLDES